MEHFASYAKNKNLRGFDYDPVSGTLTVWFSAGTQYEYAGVPEERIVSLRRAMYPDKVFTQTIKGKFTCRKVEDDGATSNLQTEVRGMRNERAASCQRMQRGGPSVLQQVLHADGSGESNHSQSAQESRRVMEFYREADGLKFTEEGHRYEMNGKRIISLTQILDAAGLVNYDGIDPAVLANKAKFGTKVHTYCLWNDQGELDMDDLKPYPNYWNRVEGWRQFAEDFNFVPTMEWCEVPCAVKVNGMMFAMTIDRFGFTGRPADPVPTVVEIKTCADREFSHQIQTAAQAIPFRGDGSVPLKRMAVYLLDKPNQANRFYFCQPHDDRTDEKLFMAALMLTQARINNKLLKGY